MKKSILELNKLFSKQENGASELSLLISYCTDSTYCSLFLSHRFNKAFEAYPLEAKIVGDVEN